jgi:hypothetical protein
MSKEEMKSRDPTSGNQTPDAPAKPVPRVRSARVFRTLVLTALAALPMKACSGARQQPADRPAEASPTEVGDDDRDAEEPATADSTAALDAGSEEPTPGPDEDASGTVFRGGPSDGGTEPDASAVEDTSDGGRVWRGGPGEEHHEEERDDAGTARDDGRGARDDAGRRDAAPPPPVTDYGVPMPLYGVEPYPGPVPAYAVPAPMPEYAVMLPPDDDEVLVPKYGVPLPDDDGPVVRYAVPFSPHR